jgi:lipopolysaccharide exporter
MLQRGSAFLFGFGSYVFLVRYLSVEDVGVWVLYVAVSTTVEMSRASFIQNTFIKFFNETDVNKEKLFASSFFLNILSTMIFIVGLVALIPAMQSFWDSQTIGVLVLWYCATCVVLTPFTQINYLEQANHSFAGVFWSSTVRQGFFFVVVVICYWFIPGLPLAFFASMQTLGAFLGLVTAWLISRKIIPGHFSVDWILFRKLAAFGKYILGTGVTSAVGKNTDQFVLGSVSHPIVALYNAGVRILNFIEIPSAAISNVVYPKMAARASEDGREGIRDLYEKSVATILGFILPVVLGILMMPEFVLRMIAGERYVEAADVLRILVAATILAPFNIQLGAACEVMNKPHAAFYINLVSNILNVVLNIIFIRYFGIIGAAASFALTLIFIFVVGQLYLRQQIGVRFTTIFRRLIEFYSSGITGVFQYFR